MNALATATPAASDSTGLVMSALARRPIVIGIAVAYVVIGLATLTVFPMVWMDEPWIIQSAWSFSANGDFAIPMFADLAGFDDDNVAFGRLYLIAVAGAFEALGTNALTARLVSFVASLIALAAVYGIGRELWSPRVGAIAMILLAVAPNFVLQSHDARPEIALVAAWTVALYLGLSGDRLDSRWRLFAAGLLATLSTDVHFNGWIMWVAVFVVLLIRGTDRRKLLVFLAGVPVGVAWWLAAHATDPSLLSEQMSAFGRPLPITTLADQPLTPLLFEIARYVLVVPRLSLVLLGTAAVATIVLLVRYRDRSLVALLVFSGIVFLAMTLFAANPGTLYAVLLWPVVALLAARLISTFRERLAWAAVGTIVLLSIAAITSAALQSAPADYDRWVAALRASVPEGARIQAPTNSWYGFIGQPFLSSDYFRIAGSYPDEIRRLGIEYIVADPFFLDEQVARMADPASIWSTTSSADFDPDSVYDFISDHTVLHAEVSDPHYGGVLGADGPFVTRIYRVIE